MAENPIPEELTSYAYFTEPRSGPKPIYWKAIPELIEFFEANHLKRDFKRRFAEKLSNNTKITHLFWGTGYTSQLMLDCLTTIRSLEALKIGLSRYDDLSSISNLVHLKYLSMDSTGAATDLSPICQLENLESLSLGLANRVTTLDAFSSNRLSKLRAFIFGSSTESPIRLESLEPLGALKSLEYLVICQVRTKDQSLAGIAELPRLKALHYDRKLKFESRDLDVLDSRGVDVSTF